MSGVLKRPYLAGNGQVIEEELDPAVIRIPVAETHNVAYVSEHAPDIKWEDDDLQVEKELKELGDLFTLSYHYSVETWNIPHDKPVTMLQARLTEFLKYERPESLLIVYYAGHAAEEVQRNEPPVWTSRRQNPARLPSSIVQSLLIECDSDVLILYDCCHAVPSTTSATGRGVTEVLAACGFEGIAAEVGPNSFTHSLIQEFGKSSYGSISVGELYGQLIDRLRTWKPCISKDPNGSMKVNHNGNPLFERPRRKTPIHHILVSESRRRSIVLSPLSSDSGFQKTSLQQRDPSINPSECMRKRRAKGMQKAKRDGEVERSVPSGSPQVILSIRVSHADFDINTWLEWIRDVPPEATKVEVDGIYGSLSTLIILRMPISLWSLLPDDPAYSFIGFVTTENLATNLSAPKNEPKSIGSEHHNKTHDNMPRQDPSLKPLAQEKDKKKNNVYPLPNSLGSALSLSSSIKLEATPQHSKMIPHQTHFKVTPKLWECHECGAGGIPFFVASCPGCDHRCCEICTISSLKR